MYEKRLPFIVPYLIGYSLGSFLQIAFDDGDITPTQVEEIQGYNTQIEADLGRERQFGDISELRLTVDGKEYEFQSGGRSCEGEYEVTKGVASLTGDIACTEITPTG